MAEAVARHVVAFGRVLREAGLEVGPGRVADALAGLDLVDLSSRDDVYWTLRQTLVSRWEDLDIVRRRVRRVVPPGADGAGLSPRDGDDVAAAPAARRRGEALRRGRRSRRGPLLARLQPRGAPAHDGTSRT